MARLKPGAVEQEAVRVAASLMAASARTAPKARGRDSIQTLILDGDDLELVAAAMEKKPEEKSAEVPFFSRDAANVRNSAAILLIGVTGEPKKIEQPLNCGACGHATCDKFLKVKRREGEDFSGPNCLFQAIDLGIALGSAVKMASELNIDNRIMYTVGAAARRLKLLDADIVMGIPLSATGKSIYFDREQ